MTLAVRGRHSRRGDRDSGKRFERERERERRICRVTVQNQSERERERGREFLKKRFISGGLRERKGLVMRRSRW